jgi:hypothetical protein
VVVEYIVLERLEISKYFFPWYGFWFDKSYYFYGNLVSSEGGVVAPDNSSVLGIFGWPHFTAATLIALFAFIYPFIVERQQRHIVRENPVWITRLSSRFFYFLILVIVIFDLFVLAVKMPMFIFLFIVLLFGPFLVKKKNIGRGLVIIVCLAVVVLANKNIFEFILSLYVKGFVAQSSLPGTFTAMFPSNPVYAIIDQGILNIPFGIWDPTGGSEMRLLNYTLHLGLVWLVLFLSIVAVSLKSVRKILRIYPKASIEYLFSVAAIYLIMAYFIDTVHYARVMWPPNYDIFAVTLGALSNIRFDNKSVKI